jgi:YHYH protein
MIRKITFLAAAFLVSKVTLAQGPEITSWIINTTGDTGYGNIPSNVQQVSYTATDVYVNVTGVPDYTIGPWPGNPNTPVNTGFTFKLTRSPQANTAAATNTPLGHIGVWKNGVTLFNAKDAMSYNNQNIWHQNAIVVEGPSFDECLGHPAPNGEYHHHLNPTCLWDDTDATQHAPILGYAFDGFPIYGGYSYANSDGTGAIVRMESSYQLRNITERTTLSDGTALPANQYGPAIDASHPLGYYIEDYEYIEGLGDLDEHNGRICETPEYPNGTYCYFVTIDNNYDAMYPYIIGPTYYGTVQPGNIGPNSGNNTVPADATVYTPSGVINLNAINLSIATSANAWTVLGASVSSYQVYNTSGQMVSIGNTNEVNNEMLSQGLYFIRLEISGEIVELKMMK